MFNRFTGPVPTFWGQLPKLDYVDVSYNLFTGTIPIFTAAQDLKGVEFSGNDFSGPYPSAYFDIDKFLQLEYVNANFNSQVHVPEFCVRYAFCFKSKIPVIIRLEVLNQARFGNVYTYVSADLETQLRNISAPYVQNAIDL